MNLGGLQADLKPTGKSQIYSPSPLVQTLGFLCRFPVDELALYKLSPDKVETTFREGIDRCADICKNLLAEDLRDILFTPGEKMAKNQTCLILQLTVRS